MLGECWTDELKKDEYIKLWASTGPKCYYYESNLGKSVTKIKGFTLNYQSLEKLNGNTMMKLIKENMSELKQSSIDLTYNRITRDKN